MSLFTVVAFASSIDHGDLMKLSRKHRLDFREFDNWTIASVFEAPSRLYVMESDLGLGELVPSHRRGIGERVSHTEWTSSRPSVAECTAWLTDHPEEFYALGDICDFIVELLRTYTGTYFGLLRHWFSDRLDSDEIGYVRHQTIAISQLAKETLLTLQVETVYRFN